MIKFTLRTGYLLLLLLLGVLPTLAQDINQPLPDIPPGQQLTITYQAQINEVLPPNVTTVINQGVITGDNFETVVTDDPGTKASDDRTITPLAFNLDVQMLPETGQGPWWRLPLLMIAAGGAVGSLWLAWRSMQRRIFAQRP